MALQKLWHFFRDWFRETPNFIAYGYLINRVMGEASCEFLGLYDHLYCWNVLGIKCGSNKRKYV